MRQAMNDTAVMTKRGPEKSGDVQRRHVEENALHRSSGQPRADQTEDGSGGEKAQA